MKFSAFDIVLVSVVVVFSVVFAARFVCAFREASRRDKESRRGGEDE